MIPKVKHESISDKLVEIKGLKSQSPLVEKMIDVLLLPKGTTMITCDQMPMKGYALRIDESVHIDYNKESDLFYGLITLKNYLGKSIASRVIEDYPDYKYRGLMLDVARHFYDIEELYKIVDICSELKMNKFHIHLTDDQGWRFESKKFPKLHLHGSYRPNTKRRFKTYNTPVSGYYSQSDLRDLVIYAKERFVEIIPEIDLPGHMMAGISSYPQWSCEKNPVAVSNRFGIFDTILCAGSQKTMNDMFTLVDEVIDVFNCRSIHIGCDEAPLKKWATCQTCQTYMKEKGLVSSKDLFLDFIERIKSHVRKKDVEVIIWNDPLKHGRIEDVTVQHWMNRKITMENGRSNPLIISDFFHHYFDYPIYMTPLKKTYDKVLDHPNIIGIEGCLWTEHMPTINKVHDMMFPRIYAISELAWGGGDYEDFEERVKSLGSYDVGKSGLVSTVKSLFYMVSTVSVNDIFNSLK
ncbi:hypothetical protein EZV73_11455 [Acidaminobacter sp. JC074]|uniref:beta-N-acetylhexosaminidase n=1 Tax=Acidaminobacter sp. JC074 TaxID=2530199 RepID=UPI001F113533|nr:family 20 glycosylhydrolase [Acidaminobacter sp. JC074]MCH4888194.1 hypothetical protein [Acidaminobacter sp. JC074]